MAKDPTLTALLNQALAGDASAAERAWSEIYQEVRAVAAGAIAREASANPSPLEVDENDLSPTLVVNEIFIRLGRSPPLAWDSRRHFFGAVRNTCEQVLVDEARRRNARKRGNGRKPIPLTFVKGELAKTDTSNDARDFGLPTALEALARAYPRAAEAARLKYMEVKSSSEIAAILQISESTTEKDLAFARAWLKRWIDEGL